MFRDSFNLKKYNRPRGAKAEFSLALMGTSELHSNVMAIYQSCVIYEGISEYALTPLVSRYTSVGLDGVSDLQLETLLAKYIEFNLVGESAVVARAMLSKYISTTINSLSDVSAMFAVWRYIEIYLEATSEFNGKLYTSRHTSSTLSSTSYITSVLHVTKHVSSTVEGSSRLEAVFSKTYVDLINAPSRIFGAYVEIYIDEDTPIIVPAGGIEMFSLLEELKADTVNPIGDITSNEFSLHLDNSNRNFSPHNKHSPYYGKLRPGIKIKPYLTIYENLDADAIIIGLGTFYTGDWIAPSHSVICTVVSHDRMYELKDTPFDGISLRHKVTYSELYRLVLMAAGLLPSEFTIDSRLDRSVKIAYVPEGTIGTALRYLSEASGSYITVDRDDKLVVMLADYEGEGGTVLSASEQIQASSAPAKYLETYSTVNVPTHTATLRTNEEVVGLRSTELEPGVNELNNVHFSRGPVSKVTRIEVLNHPDIRIRSYKATTESISLVVYNPGEAIEADISIYGDWYEFVPNDHKREDELLKTIVKDRELLIANHLVQTTEHSDWVLDRISKITSNPSSRIELEIRGNPRILPGDIVTVDDIERQVGLRNMLVTRSVLEYRGSIRGILSGYLLPEEV